MDSKPLIIGITGTLGAGKGTVVEYLIEKRGFKHYSASGFITEEIIRRGMVVNRDSMREVADDLRSIHSPSFVVDSCFERAKQDGGNAIIESIRCPGEVDSLKEKDGFILFAVDADSKIRHGRVLERGSSKDDISYEKFLSQEEAESHNVEPFKMNLPKCISQADCKFDNNGSFDDLYEQIEVALGEIEDE